MQKQFTFCTFAKQTSRCTTTLQYGRNSCKDKQKTPAKQFVHCSIHSLEIDNNVQKKEQQLNSQETKSASRTTCSHEPMRDGLEKRDTLEVKSA